MRLDAIRRRIQRGDVRHCSFAFRPIDCDHDWQYLERQPGETYTGYCEQCSKCQAIQQIPQ